MGVSYALLGLLEGTARHGYELKREYDTRFADVWPVKFGQIYATLARLERDGLVRLDSESPGRGPGRKLYAITDRGIGDFSRWLRQPEPAKPYIQSVLFMKTVLALQSGRPARQFLETQRAQHMKRMRELTRRKAKAGVAEEVLIDYALHHLDADLRWIELTQARLDALRRQIRSPSAEST